MCSFRIQLIVPTVLLVFALMPACLTSDAPAAEEQPPLILSSAPAAPPESAEARIALRQHREATALNRFTFPGNVLDGTGDLVDNWIVMFCPGWHEKCQGLLPSYELLGVQWENKLNKALMSSSVRFAKVDCATNKALCVSLGVDDYPSVIHYRNQQRVSSWHGGAPGLVRFVKQAIEGTKRRPSRQQTSVPQTKVSPTCDETSIYIRDSTNSGDRYRPLFRNGCLVLALLAAARCLWLIASSSFGQDKSSSTSKSMTTSSQRSKHRTSSKEDTCSTAPTSLETCLPKEWGRERPAIVL